MLFFLRRILLLSFLLSLCVVSKEDEIGVWPISYNHIPGRSKDGNIDVCNHELEK